VLDCRPYQAWRAAVPPSHAIATSQRRREANAFLPRHAADVSLPRRIAAASKRHRAAASSQLHMLTSLHSPERQVDVELP
jgi:hypothetical protein